MKRSSSSFSSTDANPDGDNVSHRSMSSPTTLPSTPQKKEAVPSPKKVKPNTNILSSPTAPTPPKTSIGKAKPHTTPDVKEEPETPPHDKKSPARSPRNRAANGENGEWTPDKRERFMDTVFGLGMKAANVDKLSEEFGVSKLQIRNATQVGRKGNFRDKACKAVRGE